MLLNERDRRGDQAAAGGDLGEPVVRKPNRGLGAGLRADASVTPSS